MIESIDLSKFKLTSNYLLCKPEKNFNIVAIDGPEGKKIELTIISPGEHEATGFSISGTVIKRPNEIVYFNRYSDYALSLNQQQFASAIKASAGVNCEHPYKEGDTVYYNYNVQLQSEEEGRLVETEEHGICMLIPVDSLFGYVKDDELVPLNGYVFFKRESPDEMTASGKLYIPEMAQKHYGKNTATVIACGAPVKGYLDGGLITNDVYQKGDKVIIDKRFGYKVAYDLYAGDLKNIEVCFQKHIVCVLEEELV